MNASGHPVWYLITGACLFWYTFVTLYVAWKGVGDIRRMLQGLREGEEKG